MITSDVSISSSYDDIFLFKFFLILVNIGFLVSCEIVFHNLE